MVNIQPGVPPPTVCPSGQCELRTLTASQLGSFLALLVGLLIYFTQFRQSLTGRDYEFYDDFIMIFTATFLYYFLAELSIEETSFLPLRTLAWPGTVPKWLIKPSNLEFILRTGVAIIAAVSISTPTSVIHFLGLADQVDWGLMCMMVIYGVFLSWDALVLVGGKPDVVANIFYDDLAASILCLLCAWAHMHHPHVATKAAMLLFFVPLKLIFQEHMADSIFRVFRGRESLR